ncbi:MAG: metallophosphoesterase [Desulfomonile tiedjei]|uniref:Metallophosphoesterase n=1 Tax=Desulfomonile tiedjei TaxID=2358 RepID=A0A9D6V1C6_9BACT|nr:metallophosphoesterase [Desulfomonile tiedjei]
MDRIFIFLAVIASLVILCQWFVYSSIRKYVFQRYRPITRKVAYFTLSFLAILNLVGSRLALDSDALAVDTMARQLAAVVYFSYLGSILALCVVFLALGWISMMLDLRGLMIRYVARLRAQAECFKSCKESRMGATTNLSGASEMLQTDSIADCKRKTPQLLRNADGSQSLPANFMARRTFLKWSSVAGVTAVAGFSADGLAEAFDDPVVEQFDFLHPKLAGLSTPVTIAQITDFHLGMFFDSADLEKLVRKLNSLEFDALFITGDMFHSPMTHVDLAVPALRGLRPRTVGNFAVLGNHDFYAGVTRSVECLKQSGLVLLRDQWLSHRNGKSLIHIGGIDDPRGNWVWGADFPRFGAFIKSAPEAEGLRILLSHRPNVLPSAARHQVDFVVSGHVHGGQIIVPVGTDRGFSIARIASHYTHGWYAENKSRMYLSRGVGLTFIPWRINCPPEIAVFHLKPSNDGQIRVVRTETQGLELSG